MSRINEALSRRPEATANRVSEAVGDQAAFTPAWTVSNGRTAEEARHAEVTEVRGPSQMVSFSSKWRERLACGTDAHPALVEQYRRLAAILHNAQQANGIRSLMVTSAMPADGKTLTAVNLAIVLSESYRSRVLLVDADLRRPSIPAVVELNQGAGLGEVLRATHDQKLALVALTPRLTVLPAGQPLANSIEALTSPRMRQIVEEAVTRYDWVILDAPPIGAAADARLLTTLVDGSLFVIRAGQSQYPDVQKAVDTLGRDHLLGVVLNDVELEQTNPYAYAYRATATRRE